MLEKRAANLKIEGGGGIGRDEGMEGGARRELCTKKHYHNCHF